MTTGELRDGLLLAFREQLDTLDKYRTDTSFFERFLDFDELSLLIESLEAIEV